MTPPNLPETPTTPPAAPPPTTPPASDNTKPILALILGILSLLCCGFFSGIPAIFVGHSAIKDIDKGRSAESNRTLAKLGFILGIVGTVLSILGLLAYAAIILFAVMSGKSTPSTF